MTPISLMPPVDYCPSCEGKKAESQALQIGEARAHQAELRSEDAAALNEAAAVSPVDAAAPAGDNPGTRPVDGAVSPLLAPDLAVQATLARPEIDAAGGAGGEAEALRLQAAQAYAAR